MTIGHQDIVFLLAAGASAEANIPTSAKMIQLIEEKLEDSQSEWNKFRELYYHIKSAIYYAHGLRGYFDHNVPYNIETLVNTLYELERNEEHPIYPFIAAWNSRFVSLAGESFKNVSEFRKLILRELKKWVSLEDPVLAEYYKGFVSLQRELNFPLRIFSLNYDLCIERLEQLDFHIETGFEDNGPQYFWDRGRFEYSESGPPPPQIYLYKIHGSINWKRDKTTQNLYAVEQTESVEPEQMELIFGRDFKLEAADPYLFYVYEFRRHSLTAKLIVIIGYGFADSHINKILSQTMKENEPCRLLIVCNCNDERETQKKKIQICEKLQINKDDDRIIVKKGTAKEFLTDLNLKETLEAAIPYRELPF
ncbi:MAG: SIR2 family protein [Firmicutes bacterium]|nr:SIR2 family protein [Bacillota bacterium]